MYSLLGLIVDPANRDQTPQRAKMDLGEGLATPEAMRRLWEVRATFLVVCSDCEVVAPAFD